MDNFDANAKKEIKLMKSIAKKCVKPIQLDIFSLCGELCYVFKKVSSSNSRVAEGMSVLAHTSSP